MKTVHKTQHARPKARAESPHEHEPMGPLWVITIGMAAFFGIAALVMMVG